MHLSVRFQTGLLTVALGCSGFLALAEDPLPSEERLRTSPVLRDLIPNPVNGAALQGAAQILSRMHVPPGFRVDLVAGEPDLQQPIAFAWDERGRLWVAEAYSYPTKRPRGEGLDKIVIFEDRDGDGRFETRKVFAEGLNLVSGLEVGHGGVWVGAAPELLFLPDRNHDDVPDGPPEVLLDGFGFQDTHECLNSFLWGPDGWLYGNQGVFNLAHIGRPGAPEADRIELRAGVWRYHPVSHQFEVFAYGGSNPWGLDYDARGQLFMTHCRSYWGGGCTTHVIQGGHYWNQANANYAPFIVAEPPSDYPSFQNYLLASARYDHGAGGAGAPGSDAIYGGHSHVGTLIYQGDNWPERYRGHLFTHNLGGHQINQEVNLRRGSGFETVSAGSDIFFCTDPAYVAVDLQTGPDGAVYFIDWSDPQHCHNPNTERWDRTNGRMYRMSWAATYHPVSVDLGKVSDLDLARYQTTTNDWYARTARRLLQERAQAKPLSPEAQQPLVAAVETDPDPVHRLRALWTLYGARALGPEGLLKRLRDSDEFVRGWAVALASDTPNLAPDLGAEMVRLAENDPSPVVRRYLASAIQRVPSDTAWALADRLAQHGEDREDRTLPLLLWDGIALRMPQNLDHALALAAQTKIPVLADYVWWYAAALNEAGLDRAIAELGRTQGEDQRRRLVGVGLALSSRAQVAKPTAWASLAPALYSSSDVRVRHEAERLAAVFGDESAFPRLRATLANTASPRAEREHAFAVLSRGPDRAALPVLLPLLDDETFRSATLPLLSRYDAPEIAPAVLSRFDRFSPADRAAALTTLTSRPRTALALLDAVAQGRVQRDQLTAFQIRQLASLQDPEVDRRVTATWGRILQTPAEKQELIRRLEKTFDEAPLWAYSEEAGREHFKKLCAVCHRLGDDGVRLGPELTGAGSHGIRYFLENVIDPNAVIGADFQLTVVETKSGDVLSGIVLNENAEALTLRTTTSPVVIAKADLARRETSSKSLMPEGLLESMGDRERLELLKYLTSH